MDARIHFVRVDLDETPHGEWLRWVRRLVTLHDWSCEYCHPEEET